MAKKFLTPIGVVSLASDPASGSNGQIYFNTTTNNIKVYYSGTWNAISGGGGGTSGYPQPTEPTSPTEGVIWVDTDATSPNYPQFPTVIYSPTDPSASLTVADTGTIWVDEDSPLPIETVVPAILYQASAPTGLNQNDVGYLWVDSDENIIEYNMNDYALKTYVDSQISSLSILNQFLLAGM